MNSDADNVENALSVLRRNYGEQLLGPQHSTEAQMRLTLQQQLGVEQATAGDILRSLVQSGKVTYVAYAGTSTNTTETGPVISMPTTQSADGGAPLITTADPSMLMGFTKEEGGDSSNTNTEEGVASASGVGKSPLLDVGSPSTFSPTTSGASEEMEKGDTGGYWRIG